MQGCFARWSAACKLVSQNASDLGLESSQKGCMLLRLTPLLLLWLV